VLLILALTLLSALLPLLMAANRCEETMLDVCYMGSLCTHNSTI
jgi:hypothetical protein